VADERRAIAMKRTFAASVTQEGEWYVAQCLEVDVASQGETEEEALANLGEALTLALSSPDAMSFPELRMVEIEVGGA
jgi:predicted RNase H-like HicB family nuclease